MMLLMSFLIFAGALAAVLAVFAFTLLPALPHIVALLSGEREADVQIVGRFVLNDRRSSPRLMAVAQVRRAAA